MYLFSLLKTSRVPREAFINKEYQKSKKKTQRDGLVKEARRRKAYEKPSERIKRRRDESVARRKKARRGEYVT